MPQCAAWVSLTGGVLGASHHNNEPEIEYTSNIFVLIYSNIFDGTSPIFLYIQIYLIELVPFSYIFKSRINGLQV